MNNDLITIIMPCFNTARTISDSIHSVLSQSYQNIELITVDDGSSDNTVSILNQLSHNDSRIHVITQVNKGAGPARNAGIKNARGKFIAFLDSDDTWEPDCLQKLHAALVDAPDACLAYCGWQNLGVSENRGKPFVPPDYQTENKLQTLLEGCRWPIHAALVRKEHIDNAHGFDETLTSCMDFDLWLRVAAFNRIILVPEVLAYYHHHAGEQITKNKVRIARNHWTVQQKFIKAHPEIKTLIPSERLLMITHGELKKRAYECYWSRDLEPAREIFRMVFKTGYWSVNELKYILPCFLPLGLHKKLIGVTG